MAVENNASTSAGEDEGLRQGSPATTAELHRLCERLQIEFRPTLEHIDPPRELVHGEYSRLLGAWGKQEKAIPVAEENGSIVIAMSDPRNTRAADILRFCYQKPIRIIVSPEAEIIRVINNIRSSLMSDRTSSLNEGAASDDSYVSSTLKIDVTDAEDDEAPIIRYVNTMIFRAASERASDIHIEPFEDVLKVRFRIDGVLQDVDTEYKQFHPAIVSRIKVMSNLNIAEKRLPQDGRIGIRIAGQDVDIRVSTVPTRFGERIVMRLLDKSKVMLDLTVLGLLRENRDVLERLIKRPYGIILVTGPTGSGKTTTLYACLTQINSEDKNILTVEDPVEYELRGVGQMQVNPNIDFTFAKGLRSILRQDPDVIMVGEIRDLETVEVAIQASLTGHLVFSTLHTNDAPGAITRLLDMGVEPFLISSSLLAILAQRLVRTLCPSCKVEGTLSAEDCAALGIDAHANRGKKINSPHPGGCRHCQQSGYRGRTGIHELLLIDDDIRSAIMRRADSNQIRSQANDLKSLRIDGVMKVLSGITSIEEVLRVTQEDIFEG